MNTENSLQVTFFGGVGTVTGANFLLESDTTKLLVDCGLIQGELFAQKENQKVFPYDTSAIEFLFITHAHIDHIGRIPKLVKEGFKGVIYSTPETLALAALMLADAQRVMEFEAKREGVPVLYTKEDIEHVMTLWKEIPYHHKQKFSSDFEVYLTDAGHILGSSIYTFTHIPSGKKIAFGGDLGNSPEPIIKDTEFVTDIDYLVMDSVYGDRNHEDKDVRDKKFEEIIRHAIDRKATVVIPAFSLERTQVILYELNNLIEDKKIPAVSVFLDSPLAIELTRIYRKKTQDFNPAVQKEIREGDDIFNFPKLKVVHSAQESMAILHAPNPKIIIAGSGMSNGGRVLHHEINYLPDPNSTLLLMGYQAVGTLGRQLEEGAKEVLISNEKVTVKARIESIGGYSAHKDSDHLVEFAEKAMGEANRLKRIFVVMGEPKASLFLVQKLRDNLNVDALYPEAGKVYKL